MVLVASVTDRDQTSDGGALFLDALRRARFLVKRGLYAQFSVQAHWHMFKAVMPELLSASVGDVFVL